jgi:hypothetical protein
VLSRADGKEAEAIDVRQSPELAQLSDEAFQKGLEGDDDWFEQHLGNGSVMAIGTAPDEIWRGRDEVLSLTTGRVRELNDEAGIADSAQSRPARKVEAYEVGDAGWIVTHSSFVLPDGALIPIRAITLLARVDGGWKSVLTATHVVVSNDLLAPGSPLATPPAS